LNQPASGPGEGGVARPEHQRDQEDGHRLHHRHGEEEHHRRAVHGEELVVAVRRDQPALRPGELQPHQQSEDAGEDHEAESRDEIAAADLLVVGRRKPADQPRLATPGLLQPRLERRPGQLRAVPQMVARRHLRLHRSVSR
jgi:hypothetical protein